MNLIAKFLDYLALEKNYSKHTIIAYQKDLQFFEAYIKNHFSVTDLTKVPYSFVRSWISELVDQKTSNRSINRKISSLKAFYKYLQKIELIETSPLQKHKALKVAQKVQVPFSKKELEAVLHSFEDKDDFRSIRDKLIVELFYSTGIRRIELVSLREHDIDLSSGSIKVLGKRNKERVIPLLDSVQKTLNNYLTKKRELNYSAEYLLVTDKGDKIYETLVYRLINAYFSEVSSKVKKSPHIIRHSFATHLLNEGANLNSVKELLGHSTLASTQVYTHNSLDALKKVYNQAHPRSDKKDTI